MSKIMIQMEDEQITECKGLAIFDNDPVVDEMCVELIGIEEGEAA